jgi:hypothetical protein
VATEPRPKIAAVVDWEMATLGDPLADLGLTLIYWTDPGEESYLNPSGDGLNTDATTSPGFLTRAEFAAGYASRTGRDISRIGYYMAFAYFKLAVVLEGINARYLQHQTVGEGFDREGRAVPLLIARAHDVLDSIRLQASDEGGDGRFGRGVGRADRHSRRRTPEPAQRDRVLDPADARAQRHDLVDAGLVTGRVRLGKRG